MRSATFFTLFLQVLLATFAFAANIPRASNNSQSGGNLPNGPLYQNETMRAYPLPVPGTKLDMRVVIDILPPVVVGPATYGQRVWIPFSGGRWTATWGSGTIVGGGQDAQIVLDDLSGRVDTRYILKTDDEEPAYIYISTLGWRTGPREILQLVANAATADSVKPTQYSSRLYLFLETGDERYSFLNTAMWIASSSRRSTTVLFDAYRIS